MAHFVLLYDFAPDYLARRPEYRPTHLACAEAAVARGDLLLGGPVGEPPDAAIILFQGDSPAAAEAFARADPYVVNGLVTAWRVRRWTTVVGEGAADPLPPGAAA